MVIQYQAAQLLRLKDSPLVCKPAGLPRVEEWMGSLPEQTQRKPVLNRAKTEDPSSYHETTSNRPTLFETRHASRGSSNVPADIVLGPPKTAFASATPARSANKPHDSPARAKFGSYPGDSTHHEIYSKDKPGRDNEKPGGEGYRTKLGAYSRRSGREEGEHWAGLRSGKDRGSEDQERSARRNGDRDSGQDRLDHEDGHRTQQRGFEGHKRDINREKDEIGTPRRNGLGRGNRPSWYRDDDTYDGHGLESTRESTKGRDWRDGDRANRRGGDRDWTRGAKVEQDPEWMLEPDAEEKKQKHTADDIEQWKASMRASRATLDQPIPAMAEPLESHNRSASGALLDTESLKIETPLGLDPKFDKFFGMWNESSAGSGTATGQIRDDSSRPDTGKLNAPKSSRFTGFFSPKPEPQPPASAETDLPASSQPLSIQAKSTNADKEGFQRILQMLGGGNLPAGPATAGAPPMGSHSNLLSHLDQKPRARTPPPEQPSNKGQQSPPILSPRSRKSIALESLLGLQSPRENALPQNSDSQFLLDLMKPKSFAMNHPPQHSQNPPTSIAPGILPHPNTMSDATQPHYFTEPLSEDSKRQDKLNPTTNRRLQRGPENNLFDGFGDTIAQLQQPQQQHGLPPHFTSAPGLQRPPGFDQLPPNYIPHLQPPPPQRQSIIAPPPGFQNPSRNPNQFPPGLIPNLANMNIVTDRGVPFGIRQIGPSPNGPPPPGFMAMGNGPPPPGFPPMSIPPDERLFYRGGPQRQPMDTFGEFGAAGVGGIPGHFRRPE